jgi:hypothetical protein
MDHFSDKDVRKIITRAMELQRAEAGEPQHRTGIADLEQIADEVGIDRSYVRRAAEELAQHGRGGWRAFLGAPVTRTLNAAVASGETPPDLEELAVAIPMLSGDAGAASTVGRTLTWITDKTTYDEKGHRTQVEIQVREKATTVRISESVVPIAGGLFGGLIGGLGLGGGLGVGLGVGVSQGLPAFAAAFPVAMLGFGYLLARLIYRAVSRSRSRRLQELMRALVERLESGAAGADSREES